MRDHHFGDLEATPEIEWFADQFFNWSETNKPVEEQSKEQE